MLLQVLDVLLDDCKLTSIKMNKFIMQLRGQCVSVIIIIIYFLNLNITSVLLKSGFEYVVR